MCHEIAHIYCEHGYPASISEGLAQEFEADAVGYDIYLKLMIKNMHNSEAIASSVFREYLYTAPMILFLFYHDLYKMGYWLYGEKIPDTHPPLSERIDKLFDISMGVPSLTSRRSLSSSSKSEPHSEQQGRNSTPAKQFLSRSNSPLPYCASTSLCASSKESASMETFSVSVSRIMKG